MGALEGIPPAQLQALASVRRQEAVLAAAQCLLQLCRHGCEATQAAICSSHELVATLVALALQHQQDPPRPPHQHQHQHHQQRQGASAASASAVAHGRPAPIAGRGGTAPVAAAAGGGGGSGGSAGTAHPIARRAELLAWAAESEALQAVELLSLLAAGRRALLLHEGQLAVAAMGPPVVRAEACARVLMRLSEDEEQQA